MANNDIFLLILIGLVIELNAVEAFGRKMFIVNNFLIAQEGMQQPAVTTREEYHQIRMREFQVGNVALDFSQ